MINPNGLPIVYVGRPSKWGNRYQNEIAEFAVYDYKLYLFSHRDDLVKLAPKELKGKNLSCWCPLNKPCHADILLKIANQ